jgi:hypothetical protein
MSTEIDPRIIPWSHRGSYLCLATRSGSNGRLTPGHDIYLISHILSGGLPLFSIRPQIGNVPAPLGFPTTPSLVEYSATPSILSWSYEGKVVAEATWASPSAIRLRGNVPVNFNTEGKLKVDQWRCWMFRVPGTKSVEFNSTPNTALRFTALRGDISVINDAPYDSDFKDNRRQISMKGTWELVIEERDEMGSQSSEVQSFEACVQTVDKTFDDYVKGMCPWSATPADKLASYVMWTSTVRPAGFLGVEAVLMSKLWMNKVSTSSDTADSRFGHGTIVSMASPLSHTTLILL